MNMAAMMVAAQERALRDTLVGLEGAISAMPTGPRRELLTVVRQMVLCVASGDGESREQLDALGSMD